jgi:hypothetical protein
MGDLMKKNDHMVLMGGRGGYPQLIGIFLYKYNSIV